MTAASVSTDLPLKQRLKNGHVPVGTMVFEFFVPGMAQMARAVGADFLMYDTEHSGVDIEAIKAFAPTHPRVALIAARRLLFSHPRSHVEPQRPLPQPRAASCFPRHLRGGEHDLG